MKEFESIIAGVDYSEPSACALEEAFRIADWHGSRLVVAHILPEEILAAAERWTGLDREPILAGRRVRLDRFCLDTLNTALVESLSVEVIVGHPFSELMNLIQREGAGLLVLGAQGESHRHASTTGALAAQCVRKAPCEVLLVRAAQHDGFRKVTVAVDFSQTSRRALRQGAALAREEGGELHVLHVYAPAWKKSAELCGETRVSEEQVRRYLEDVEKRLADFIYEELEDFGGMPATIRAVESYSPGGGIVNYLNEVKADLVVLGTRARSRDRIPAAGSTAEFIVHDAPCSVLAVQPEDAGYRMPAREMARRVA